MPAVVHIVNTIPLNVLYLFISKRLHLLTLARKRALWSSFLPDGANATAIWQYARRNYLKLINYNSAWESQ